MPDKHFQQLSCLFYGVPFPPFLFHRQPGGAAAWPPLPASQPLPFSRTATAFTLFCAPQSTKPSRCPTATPCTLPSPPTSSARGQVRQRAAIVTDPICNTHVAAVRKLPPAGAACGRQRCCRPNQPGLGSDPSALQCDWRGACRMQAARLANSHQRSGAFSTLPPLSSVHCSVSGGGPAAGAARGGPGGPSCLLCLLCLCACCACVLSLLCLLRLSAVQGFVRRWIAPLFRGTA